MVDRMLMRSRDLGCCHSSSSRALLALVPVRAYMGEAFHTTGKRKRLQNSFATN